ncbi:MAG TPA: hypothetical protein VKP67_07135 [Xanthobacteraceae bacterium]|nr:hypothetical protein [Xanthobacteraceae bacterium]
MHLNELSATEIVHGIAAGAFNCEAVTRVCLARIADQEPGVLAASKWIFDTLGVRRPWRARRGKRNGV